MPRQIKNDRNSMSVLKEMMEELDISKEQLQTDLSLPEWEMHMLFGYGWKPGYVMCLRLAKYFGTTDTFWMDLDREQDLRVTKSAMTWELEQITPYVDDAIGELRDEREAKERDEAAEDDLDV